MLVTLAGRPAAAEQRNALYIEVFGKGGLWGLGYDYQLQTRWAVGVTGSYYAVDGEHITSISPYLGAYPIAGAHHRWFVHAGPQIMRIAIPSPVPEWDGTSRLGIGAEISSGYEYRRHILFRIFGMASAGQGGVTPWVGASFGWAL